jgi:hypothetical protein
VKVDGRYFSWLLHYLLEPQPSVSPPGSLAVASTLLSVVSKVRNIYFHIIKWQRTYSNAILFHTPHQNRSRED